jgi:hypothetical protein
MNRGSQYKKKRLPKISHNSKTETITLHRIIKQNPDLIPSKSNPECLTQEETKFKSQATIKTNTHTNTKMH